MGGGLMQLVAYGAQDIYLTGQPQITFFKSVYRRHTNFSVESIEQSVNGSPGFKSRITVTISRTGDLLKNLWVEYNPNNMVGSLETDDVIGCNVGHALFQQMELEIGGQIIDRQYGKWLTVWNYLTELNPTGVQGPVGPLGEEPGSRDTDLATGLEPRSSVYNLMSYNHRANVVDTTDEEANPPPDYAYVPMRFWFCRNPGLAIPLIALQYHEVKFNLYFNDYTAFKTSKSASNNEFNGFRVWGDYVYLDTTERRQFAQNAHEYLIDQLQVYEGTSDNNVRLNFNHPVKELIWIASPLPSVSAENASGAASPSGPLASGNYLLKLNGTDRFTARDVTYFTREEVWTHHSGYGSVLYPNSVAVYSFALRPEEHQPSGTCNFSRIDTAQLIRPANSNQAIDIFAVNYNVLRIMSGMGGLAYSN